MKKKIQCLLMLIIFLIIICYVENTSNANELIGMMKVYKIQINLINIDTDEYTIELIDEISNKIFETQEGNKKGEHIFAIATDMDKDYLGHYVIKLKFKNGEVKKFDSINVDKLINIDDDESDFSYNYKYNVRVKLLPKSVIVGVTITSVIGVFVIIIIFFKKHKKRIR